MQFLCAPLLGTLSDRFGRRPVLLISLGGLLGGYGLRLLFLAAALLAGGNMLYALFVLPESLPPALRRPV